MRRSSRGLSESAMIERVNGALRIIASFSGLAQENMSQLAGWRFLELGRRIERALATCRFVRQFAFGAELDGALDVLLELADSQITYRLRYVMVAARAPVIDLVALDPNNPRSIVYPARAHRDASGGAAEARRGEPAVAARADRDGAGRPGCAPPTPPSIDDQRAARGRSRADEALRRRRVDLLHDARALGSAMGCARMIYDVRQATTYHYASPVALCASRAAAHADRSRATSGCMPRCSTSARRRSSAAKGRISSATGSPGSRSTSRTTR